jgi:glutaredoxin-like protein
MKKIEVYGTNWCPDCSRARQIFNQHNITYIWHDIDKDKKACAFVEKVNDGFQSVPTIVFPDGSFMVEPNNAALEKKLSEAGLV